MKMKEHLHNLPDVSNENHSICLKLKDWKERFNEFLLQKRKEEDKFMQELDTLINASDK
jgi:hypothetical protein